MHHRAARILTTAYQPIGEIIVCASLACSRRILCRRRRRRRRQTHPSAEFPARSRPFIQPRCCRCCKTDWQRSANVNDAKDANPAISPSPNGRNRCTRAARIFPPLMLWGRIGGGAVYHRHAAANPSHEARVTTAKRGTPAWQSIACSGKAPAGCGFPPRTKSPRFAAPR